MGGATKKRPATWWQLKTRRSNVLIASEQASLWSLVYQPKPIAAAFTRRGVQLLFGVLGLVMILSAFSNPEVVGRVSRHVSRTKLRFTALELRDGRQDPSLVNVGSFGVMLDGVAVHAAALKSGSSLVLEFPSPTPWNQWYFDTEGLTERDPVRFALEEWQPHTSGVSASEQGQCGTAQATDNCEGGRWIALGSSSELSFHITRTLFHGHYPTSVERGTREIIDQRFELGCFLVTAATLLLFGFLLILSAIAGAVGLEGVSQTVVVSAELILSLCTGFAAVWYFIHPTSRGTNWNASFHAIASLIYLICWQLLRCNQVGRPATRLEVPSSFVSAPFCIYRFFRP